MILSRKDLMIMVGVSALAGGLLLYSLLARDGRMVYPELVIDDDAAWDKVTENAAPKQDHSAIVTQSLFSAARGRKTAVKTPEPKKTAAPEKSVTPELSMLPSYPNDWPRLKLTGVFMRDGRPGAVIQGGTALPSSTGRKYDSLYLEGDAIGGGVMLGPVARDSVILRKDKNGWKIYLGAEPPVVPKK